MNYSARLVRGRPEPRPGAGAMGQGAARARRMPACSRASACWRSAAAGAAWPSTPRADFDAHVTGVTLSTEQLAFAQERLRAQGLADQADLRLQDYRDIADGPFDAIGSIEMFEAVGRAVLARLLRQRCASCSSRAAGPASRASPSATTCSSATSSRTDFIQQYIFPGGLLPCPTRVPRTRPQRPGCAIVNELASARTTPRRCAAGACASWRRKPPCASCGFDSRFMRIWEFYLAYCEAAFATGNTDVMQFTLRNGMTRADAPRPHAPRGAAAAGRAARRGAGQPRAAGAAAGAEDRAARRAAAGRRPAALPGPACLRHPPVGARPTSACATCSGAPLALELEYARALDGEAIAERSLEGDAGARPASTPRRPSAGCSRCGRSSPT